MGGAAADGADGTPAYPVKGYADRGGRGERGARAPRGGGDRTEREALKRKTGISSGFEEMPAVYRECQIF